jgi:potassium-transporting ATPase KdpC subunit
VSDVPSRSDGRPYHLGQLRGAAAATLILTVLCGVVFPAAVWAIAQLFPENAHGSLVFSGGAPRGSRLIGQTFRSAHYFHGRPSAAGDGYDATLSGGTNLATDNPKQLALLDQRRAAYRSENQLPANTPVPADAITASASGLDPHISPENAAAQAPRVARARGVALERIEALIAGYTQGRTFAVIGEPRVDVLGLNLALDRTAPIGPR